MKYIQITVFYFLVIFLLLGCRKSVKKVVDKESENTGSYLLVEEWPKLYKNHVLGLPSGLGIDSNNNILVFTEQVGSGKRRSQKIKFKKTLF